MVRQPLKRPRRGSGMTEVVVATLIVGIMMVAALEAIGMTFRTRRLNADRLTGPGLAQDLMTEILSMPYEDLQNPGGAIGVDLGESAANRGTFDDVDDYHGWTSANAVTRAGAARTGFTGWTHTVSVAWANLATLVAGSASDTGLKQIRVTVTSPTGVASQLVAVRSRLGALEQTRPIAAPALSWVGVEMRAGTSARSQHAGAPPANHVKDAN